MSTDAVEELFDSHDLEAGYDMPNGDQPPFSSATREARTAYAALKSQAAALEVSLSNALFRLEMAESNNPDSVLSKHNAMLMAVENADHYKSRLDESERSRDEAEAEQDRLESELAELRDWFDRDAKICKTMAQDLLVEREAHRLTANRAQVMHEERLAAHEQTRAELREQTQRAAEEMRKAEVMQHERDEYYAELEQTRAELEQSRLKWSKNTALALADLATAQARVATAEEEAQSYANQADAALTRAEAAESALASARELLPSPDELRADKRVPLENKRKLADLLEGLSTAPAPSDGLHGKCHSCGMVGPLRETEFSREHNRLRGAVCRDGCHTPAPSEPAMCRADVGGTPCGEQEPCREHPRPAPSEPVAVTEARALLELLQESGMQPVLSLRVMAWLSAHPVPAPKEQ